MTSNTMAVMTRTDTVVTATFLLGVFALHVFQCMESDSRSQSIAVSLVLLTSLKFSSDLCLSQLLTADSSAQSC